MERRKGTMLNHRISIFLTHINVLSFLMHLDMHQKDVRFTKNIFNDLHNDFTCKDVFSDS